MGDDYGRIMGEPQDPDDYARIMKPDKVETDVHRMMTRTEFRLLMPLFAVVCVIALAGLLSR